MPIIGGGGGAGGPSSPGFEINYTQITGNVNVVSTTEATGTTIISPGAITFDGTAVIVEFWAIEIDTSTVGVDQSVTVSLFESATQITRLYSGFTQATASARSTGCYGKFRFTPTAASHTYTITAFASDVTGTPKVVAGSGGTGGKPPAFVRFTKA